MQTVEWDPDFESVVARFEEQEASAQVRVASLHPFDREIFSSHLREQLKILFQDLEKGYEIILRKVIELNEAGVSLAGLDPVPKAKLVSVKQLFPTHEEIEEVKEEAVEENWIEKGIPLYRELKLTRQAVAVMYETACYLLREDREEEARAAFRFILVLAPHMSDFWTAYGVVQMRLHQIDEAIQSLERAVSLDPDAMHPFLLLCRALVENNRKGEAESRLYAKLDDAARHSDQDRYDMLESARYEIARFVPT